MKKYKKVLMWVGIVMAVIIAACAVEYALYYRSHPKKVEKHIQAKGCLLLGSDLETCEVVDVEIKAQELSYLFGNLEDAVQGTIWVNGQNIFRDGTGEEDPGFYAMFHEDSPEWASVVVGDAGSRCTRVCVSKDWKTIVCVVMVDASISKEVKIPSFALLVVNVETEEEAREQLDKASEYPEMKRWLEENEHVYYGKERWIQD